MQNADDSPSAPADRDGPGVDPTEATFEDWIDHVADAEGVPAEAVRARLMSSYWILDELARHLEDASFEDLSDELAMDEFPARAAEEEPDRIRTILEELIEDARSMESRQPEDSQQPSWERLVEIVEGLDELGDPAAVPPTAAEPPAADHVSPQLEEAVRELQGQIEALGAPATPSDDEPPTDVEASDGSTQQPVDGATLEAMEADMSDQLSELEATLEAIDAEVDRLDAVLSEQTEDVSDIDARVDAQHHRLQSLGDTLSTLAEKLQGLDNHVKTNRDRLEQVDSTIDEHADHFQELQRSVSQHDADLEDAETVLRHLFGEVDTLDDRTEAMASMLRDLEPVVAAHHEREQLDALQETAAELGVRTAECEACEESVDLGLLTEPACPHCGTPADGVSSQSGLLWSKSVLESGERAEDPGSEWASALAELDPDSTD